MFKLCLHVYNPDNMIVMLKKFQPVMQEVEGVLISTLCSQVEEVKEHIELAKLNFEADVIGTDNAFNDWSGYLALLEASSSDRMIFGNDSLINRRLIRKTDIVTLAGLVNNATGPSLIGELDTSRVSVPIGSYSSTAWISSFLFGLKMGNGIDARILGRNLKYNCQSIPEPARDWFLAYLSRHRSEFLSMNAEGKLHAMYLERLLSHFLSQAEFEILNQYAGSWPRKIFRRLEGTFL